MTRVRSESRQLILFRLIRFFPLRLGCALTCLLFAPRTDTLLGAEAKFQPPTDRGVLVQDIVPKSRYAFAGAVGERIDANVEHWLLVAPKNNPGLLDMFARRDAGEKLDLVPWAGEFVGKYLISGVQALTMSNSPQLRQTLQGVVERLIELQAEDGYLGPWPKRERLLGHWDLWGHYHVMLGLMAWHDQTGQKKAFTAARRIADLVCDTYLDTGKRVIDAGAPEMNMAIFHGLGKIYRRTGQARYLQMTREVLDDFQQAGDYYRTGLAGVEFFRSPKPRWESLHSLQGLCELYLITGDPAYRNALLSHWASIRRFDQRNTGGFSSGEMAKGTPYRDEPIETCCVIAWQTVMLDALRLTGDATIADDLELATLGAALGAQHPSGAWCTYDTPMAGVRRPSHVQIAFQARADTPHLNCCSVNGPRGYGVLSEWAVMRRDQGLVINYYGPLRAEVALADGTPVTITQETDYPRDGTIELTLTVPHSAEFPLWLRIPAWSVETAVTLGGQRLPNVQPGKYLRLDHTWLPGNGLPGDRLTIRMDMRVRYEAGDLEQAGKVSLYRGPLLLAADDRFQTGDLPPIDVAKLGQARQVSARPLRAAVGPNLPWLALDVPTTIVDAEKGAANQTVRLIDFASAGATTVAGKPLSRYATWLPADGIRPPRPVAWKPADGARIGPGPIRFLWRRSTATPNRQHQIAISPEPTFDSVVLRAQSQPGHGLIVSAESAAKLQPGTPYYWKVIARNQYGQRESLGPHKHFTLDPKAPPQPEGASCGQREKDQMLVAAALAGSVEPEYAKLLVVMSRATNFALGGNPNYTGTPEFLAASVADLRLLARALEPEEIEQIYAAGRGPK